MEPSQRSRLIQLTWLTWCFCLSGFNNGILGPSLLDLAAKVNANLSQMNRIFPANGFGYLMGIIISSLLPKTNYLNLFLAFTLIGGGLVNILIPFTGNLDWLTVLFLLQGHSKGLLDTFAYTLCLQLFPEEHYWQMLMIPVAAAFAAFVIPFVVKPYQSHLVINPGANITSIANCTVDTCYAIPSRITYPYIFTTIIIIPPIFAFFFYFYRNRLYRANQEVYDSMSESQSLTSINWKDKWAIILLLFLFHIPVFGSVIAFSHLLTLYGASAPMSLPKGLMADITSVFWGSILIGRFINMILSKHIRMGILLCINFGGLIIFSSVLIAHQSNVVYLWIGTTGFGFFQSSFLPSVITWAGSFLHLNGTILSISLMANGVGEIIIPYVAALMFANYGRSSLMFLIFTLSIVEMGLFAGISSLHWLYEKQSKIKDNILPQ